MKRGGERDVFNPDGMVMFQFHRKAELLQYRGGDTRVEPPAEPIKLTRIVRSEGLGPARTISAESPSAGRTLAEVWGIQKTPFAGSE